MPTLKTSGLDIRGLAQQVRAKVPGLGDALERIQDSVNVIDSQLSQIGVRRGLDGRVYLDLANAVDPASGLIFTNRTLTTRISTADSYGAIYSVKCESPGVAMGLTSNALVFSSGDPLVAVFTLAVTTGSSPEYSYVYIGNATQATLIQLNGETGAMWGGARYAWDGANYQAGLSTTRTVKDGSGNNKTVTITGGIVTGWET